jgi:hypothetical protein
VLLALYVAWLLFVIFGYSKTLKKIASESGPFIGKAVEVPFEEIKSKKG